MMPIYFVSEYPIYKQEAEKKQSEIPLLYLSAFDGLLTVGFWRGFEGIL